MEDKSKVIDRIRKLLALSESANEHEAALAAERAQELLARYNIDLFEVEDVEEEQPVERDSSETRSQVWRRHIYQAVAKMYFCVYYFESIQRPSSESTRGFVRRDLHFFTGQLHNIHVAKMVAAYLCATIIRLANNGSTSCPKRERARYKKSFHNACAFRLSQRIRQRVERTRQTETPTSDGRNLPALASLYDQAMYANRAYLDKLNVKIRTSKSRTRSTHFDGHVDGKKAAESISLDGQIHQNEPTKKLR